MILAEYALPIPGSASSSSADAELMSIKPPEAGFAAAALVVVAAFGAVLLELFDDLVCATAAAERASAATITKVRRASFFMYSPHEYSRIESGGRSPLVTASWWPQPPARCSRPLQYHPRPARHESGRAKY